MTDGLERFAAMRPPTDADNDWANSPAGRTTLARIHRQAIQTDNADPAVIGQRRWRRPVLAVSAAVMMVGAVTAAAVVITRDPTNPAQVACMRTASAQADSVGITLTDPTPAAAVRACSSRWTTLFPQDTIPTGFAVCVYPGDNHDNAGGGQVVIPATRALADSTAACTAAGFDPITTS